jgi:predicted outer membrane repeat protein
MKMKANYIRWLLCVLFLLGTVSAASTERVIYVDDDAVGANDGSSWTDAFSDLQDAIAVAQVGDEIRVAEGVYTPTPDSLDRDATFDLKDGVSIIGGYAGLAGMYPDFRHIKFYATILSGDIDHNDDIMDPNNKEGNSRHVVTCTGWGNTAVLDGVTITGGYTGVARGHYSYDRVGGGLSCWSSSLQLTDCSFTDNHARHGAAIFTDRSSSLSLNQCIFRRNTAELSGGAIYANGDKMQLINCLFVANTAGETGGAISCSDYSHGNGGTILNVLNCTFYDNTSPTFYKPPTNSETQPDGSRVYTSGSIISNCIFYNKPSLMAVAFEFGHSEPIIVTSIYEKEQESGQLRPIPPMPEELFVDPNGADGILGTEDDDFRLAPGSPAIDSGTNVTWPPLPATDLDGNPRILNDIVDLGAYEFTDVNKLDNRE